MRKDWLLIAMENHDITPDQLTNILEQRSKADRKFREEMRVFDPPHPALISSLDLWHLPLQIIDLRKK